MTQETRSREFTSEPTGWSVVHTRGQGVHELACLLAIGDPVAVRGDIEAACVEARAELLVRRNVTTGTLIKQAAPLNLDLSGVRSVAGAIGTGPHSTFVAELAAHVSTILEVPGRLVAASEGDDRDPMARAALDRFDDIAKGLERHFIRVSSVADLVDSIPPDALLILGAPGGSWVKRQFFGPGRRIAAAAPAGAIIVADAPKRAFQSVASAQPFGPQLLIADALRLINSPAVPVADDGVLVGIVRLTALTAAAPEAAIATVMEQPVSIRWDDPISTADQACRDLDGAPVPVVGPDGRMIGVVCP